MAIMYTTICVDCSNAMQGAGISKVNMIVKAFMTAVLKTPKLRDSTEYRFVRCSNTPVNDFQPESSLTFKNINPPVSVQTNITDIQLDTKTTRKLHYPVFGTGDSARDLCETVRHAHKSLDDKIKSAQESGTAVYTGLLLVIADGGKGSATTTANEKNLIDTLKKYSRGSEANERHIIPILIDLHKVSTNTALKRLAEGFPNGYIHIGLLCPEANTFQNSFENILRVVNMSLTKANRRQQTLDAVASQLKKLK